MPHRRSLLLVFMSGFMLVIGFSVWLVTPQPVEAQCGSQASSCKNCHEVQAEMPVNNDGTGWHESHAFGDFCIFCHAGNEQATEMNAAHLGMVSLLSDVDTACKQCHSSDVMERAQVYATVLNVELGTLEDALSPATVTDEPASTEAPAVEQPLLVESTIIAPANEKASTCDLANYQLLVDDPNAVDYVQRYNEIVRGERPVNWGNITLVGVIGLIVVGGGCFVIFNERRMRRSPVEMGQVEGEYPTDVLEMLPAIAELKSQSRKSLKSILDNAEKTDKVLGLIDTVVSDEDTVE